MQTTFLKPPPPPIFNIYHDESGTYVSPPKKNDRWLMHGILFVPEDKQTKIFEELQSARNKLDYRHEVHFKKIRKYGKKSIITKEWLETYLAFSKHCFYHCLAVDTHSSTFQHKNFSAPYHVYNYFTQIAIVGGIAWFFKKLPKIQLRFYSDHKHRPDNDNFTNYVTQSTINNINKKRKQKPSAYPEIVLLNQEVILVDSDPQKVIPSLKIACELIQLTDIITASIAQALMAGGNQIKLSLGQIMASWVEDTRKPPWNQEKDLHRRFSLSCFPNEKGYFYYPLLDISKQNQSTLPLWD